MNRFRFLGYVAAFASMSLLSMHADDARAQGSPVVTGDWNVKVTGDAFQAGRLTLTQSGTTVVGHAPFKGGTAQISGKFTNQKVSGTWRAANNETGWLTLTFAADGKTFSGEWGYHGTKPNGNIVGTRAAAASHM